MSKNLNRQFTEETQILYKYGNSTTKECFANMYKKSYASMTCKSKEF